MIKLVGVPYDANSTFLRGAAMAPQRIRQMDLDGSANRFSERGREIVPGKTYEDVGDLALQDLSGPEAFQAIARAARDLFGRGSRILALGGDHSITHPIIEGATAVREPLHILHIDAHSDLYEDFGGNPHSHASPFARIMEAGRVASLTQVGIRTLNTHQREQADRFGVQVIEMRAFDLAFVEELQGPLYISLDLDGLDPAFAPGVSHHEPGGLSTRDVIDIFQRITVPVVGADIVEYNPARDVHMMTAMVAYKLMKELMDLMME